MSRAEVYRPSQPNPLRWRAAVVRSQNLADEVCTLHHVTDERDERASRERALDLCRTLLADLEAGP